MPALLRCSLELPRGCGSCRFLFGLLLLAHLRARAHTHTERDRERERQRELLCRTCAACRRCCTAASSCFVVISITLLTSASSSSCSYGMQPRHQMSTHIGDGLTCVAVCKKRRQSYFNQEDRKPHRHSQSVSVSLLPLPSCLDGRGACAQP